MKKSARWLVPLAWFLLVVGGATWALVTSETAREVTIDSLKLVFTILSTPFILETTSALLFLMALLAYNRWRLHKEGDGWVYLMTQEPEPVKGASGSNTQRLHSMVLPNPPEPVNEDENEAGVIEGYLELGLAAQALEELNKFPAESTSRLENILLRLRVLAANLDTQAALDLLHDTARRLPQAQIVLAESAGQTADWMRAHLPTHLEEAALWEREAGKIRLAV